MKNNFTSPFQGLVATLFYVVLALLCFPFAASGQTQLELNSSLTDPSTGIAVSNADACSSFNYNLNYGVVSLVENATNAELRFPLLGLDYVGFGSNPDILMVNVVGVAPNDEVVVTFVTPLPAGSSGTVTVELQYPCGTTCGDEVVDLMAGFTADNAPDANTGPDQITASASPPGLSVRVRPPSYDADSEELTYTFRLENPDVTQDEQGLYDIAFEFTVPTGATVVDCGEALCGGGPTICTQVGNVVTWAVGQTPDIPTPDDWNELCGIANVILSVPRSIFPAGATVMTSLDVTADAGNGCGVYESTRGRTSTIPEITFGTTCAFGAQLGGGDSRAMMPGATNRIYQAHLINNGNGSLYNVNIDMSVPSSNFIEVTALGITNFSGNLQGQTIEAFYTTNLNPSYTSAGTRTVTGNVSFPFPTLAAGEYITGVRYHVPGPIAPGGTLRPFYRFDVLEVGRDGTPITTISYLDYVALGCYNHQNGAAPCLCPVGVTCIQGSTLISADDINGMQVLDNDPACSRQSPLVEPTYITSNERKSIVDPATSYNPGDTITFRLIFEMESSFPGDILDVFVEDVLPAGVSFAGNIDYSDTESGLALPTFTESNGTLTWDWGSTPFAPDRRFRVNYDVVVDAGQPAGPIENCFSILSNNATPLGNNPNGDFCEIATIGSFANLSTKKWVKGSLDSEYSSFPEFGQTVPGQKSTYRFVVVNEGNVPLQNVEIFEIFPHLGDMAVTATFPRLTEWEPIICSDVVFLENINADPTVCENNLMAQPADVNILYSTEENPCRSNFEPPYNPAGCTGPTFTATPPAPISDLKSFLLTIDGPFAPLDTLVFSIDFIAPVTAVPGEISWNSFAQQAQRTDNLTFLPIAEPNKVGVTVPAVLDVALQKTLNAATPGPFNPGSTVTFDILVENQGSVPATDVQITDYLPANLTLVDDAIWQEAAGLITLETPIASIAVGGSETISISFVIDAGFAGGTITNYAEVSNAAATSPIDGLPLTDVDSTPNQDNTDDAGGQPESDADDFLGGNGTGVAGDGVDLTDEDDHDSEQITVCPVITAPVSGGNEVICVGEAIPQLSATVGAGETVDWYDDPTVGTQLAMGTTTFTPSGPLSVGTTTFYAEARLTDGSGCISATRTEITITVNPLPVVILNDPSDQCIDGTDMAFTGMPMDANGIFTTTAGAGLTDNNDGTATLDVSVAGAGTYNVTYTYTDANGCEASQTVSVEIFALPIVTLNDPADECIDGTDMVFTGMPTDAMGVFSTTAAIGFTDNGAGTASLDVSAAGTGTYDVTYTYTDVNGCDASETVSVTVNPEPIVSLNDPADECIDGSDMSFTGMPTDANGVFITTAGAGFTDNGDGTASLDVSAAGAGTYDVTYTYTDVNGCDASQTVSVTVNPEPIVTLNDPADVCIDGADMVFTGMPTDANGVFTTTAGAGFTDNGAGTASLDVSAAGVGTYDVTYTYTDINGCDASETVSVTVNPEPIVSLNDPADVCIDGSDMSFTGMPTDANGVFTTTAGSGFTDNGAGTASLDVSVAGAGTYDVTYTYTDVNGCDASQTVSVTVNPEPIVSLNDPADVCIDGADMSFTGMPRDANGVFTTTAGAGFTDNGDGTASLDVSAAGAGTYDVTYTYTDDNGCDASETVSVTVNPEPIVTLNDPADVCIDGADMSFTGMPRDANGVFTTTAGAGFTDNGDGTASLDVSAAGAGTYDVTYTYTDVNGCDASETVSVTVNPEPIVSLNDPADVCIDGSDMSFTGMPTDANGVFTTTAGAGFTDNGDGTASLDVSAAGAGTYDVTYTYTDVNGCDASETVSVTVNPEPIVSLNDPADVCIDGSDMSFTGMPTDANGVFTTTAGSGFTDNGNGTASLDVSAAGAGTYDVTYTYTDVNGCDASETVSVTVNPEPIVSLNDPADECIDGSDMSFTGMPTDANGVFITTAGSGFTDNGDGTASLDVSVAGAGTYDVTYTYTDVNGCDASETVSVTVNPLPIVSLNDPADECIVGSDMVFTGMPTDANGVFITTAGSGFTDNGDGTASLDVSVAGAGTYDVTYTYTDANGCVAAATTEVEVFGLDFGDLATPYPTAGIVTAASHCVPATPLIKLGATVDIEADGTPSTLADGDGVDEDGFIPGDYMFVRGQSEDITIPLMNITGQMAKLVMFIDWDNNGDFTGTNEMYDMMVADAATSATLSGVTPPAGAVINTNLAVRFRFSTDQAAVMSAGGNASDGEVEDYLLMVMAFDYGDLTDTGTGTAEEDYETTVADGGPVHKIITNEDDMVTLKIGGTIDDELDGQQSPDADGDGADDDGFDPTSTMFVRGESQDLTIPVMNMTGGPAKLTVYIDWNNDGAFDGPDEMYFTTVDDLATSAVLSGITPPAGASINNEIGMRFRLTTDMTMTPGGPAPDGEVEDYEIVVMAFDYGDLVDGASGTGEEDYETSSANGGPVHKIVTNEDDMVTLKIGASVDDELDGQPSDDADGDGADEDGFDPTSVMFVRGESQDLTIPVMNMTGGPAKLTVYIDWNNDGAFDGPDEMYFTTVDDLATSAVLSGITPPADASINNEIGMRFRLTTDMTMSPDGPAPDGEVEDYETMVMAFDYGDLTDTGTGTAEEDYETTVADGGPVHKIITNEDDMVTLKIGGTIDDELDGQQSPDADGDADDEDGFDPTSVMFVTGQSVDLDIPVMNMTGAPAKLTIFIDWNNNGDFTDMGEMYFVDVPDQATSVTIADIVPPFTTTLNDELGFRIRLSSDMDASMSPTGPAPDGEVEDYEIMVMGFDYGDLIDGTNGTAEQDYQTQSANGGPSHKIITNEDDMVLLKIGSLLDDEADGQQSSNATGDVTGEDDEDGFDPTSIMFMTNQSVDITIPVMNMTMDDAKLVFFIDWNNNGTFEADEMYSTIVMPGDTEAVLTGVTPPLTATLNDDLGIRIRLSTDQDVVMNPNGSAPDGEVEDYEIPVMGFDYGDLNDVVVGTNGDANAPLTPADYQTTSADNGPAHKILTDEQDQVLLKIGSTVDDEVDGQPSADAGLTGGDDNNAAPGTMDADDEDGLDLNNLPLFILTQTTTLDIPVMNMTGEDATIAVYVDFNKDGVLDPATEKFTATVADGATSVTVSVGPIPATSVVGQDVGLRIRLANDMDEVMTSTGIANSGEVEDYMVQIIGFDYGDLPDTYTTTGPDAPRHIVSEDLKLGSCVDTELDGIPEAMAGMMEGGDDADPGLATFGTCTDGSDEDGIVFSHPFIPGNESCITVTAMNMTGDDAVLQVWIDWNGDGMFGAGEELAFNDATIPPGGVDGAEYCFPVPTVVGYSEGALFIRARLSPDGGLVPDSQTGVVPFGEIEDYKVKLSKVGSLVWEDFNGNGVQDEAGDLGINSVDVELLWYGPDGDVNTTDDNRTYTVTTANDGTTDGIYSFCGLNPGTYSISIPTLPGDFVPTWSNIPGDDEIDSDDHAGVEFTIVDPMGLPEGENGTGDNPGGINGFPDMQDDLSFDFGAYIPAELGDFVWLDENFDDADDTQVSTGTVPDSPIEGVTVTLMGTNNIGQPVMLTLVTDENGFYKFTDLAPGSYKVIFDPSTALDECGPILLAVTPNVGDDALDSDIDQTTFTTPFYDLFSGDDIPTVDAGFVEPPIELGCIANLNVTLGDNCSATITPDMILTGLDGCVDEFIVTVDGTDSNVISGCGEHTYMIQIVEDGEIVYTCWGTIFAEDKTDPVVDCPDNTDEVTVDFDLQTLEGSIDGTEPTIVLDDYTCFQSFFEPAAGVDYNYDLITFTVDPDLPATDVYNIQTASNIPGLNIALFQGDFNEDNPCQNILGGSEGAYFVDPFFGINAFFDQDFRIEMPLEPGQTYTLLLANTSFGATGDYVIGIVSDNGGTFEDGGFSAPQPVAVTLPLWCEDVDLIHFETPQSWIVAADGTLDFNATRDAFFGGSTSALNAFLDKLTLAGIPVATDNCGPVLVTLSDEIEEAGDCGEITLTRTFSVADRYDGACIGAPRTDVCTQTITFNRPTVLDLILPPYTATIECDESFETDGSVGGPDDNPAASVTGYPFLLTAQGYVDLDQNYCNLGASYSDEPRIDVCEGTYSFRREWNIIDWCSPSDNVIWDQFVKVGDFTGPIITGVANEITISTSPLSCVANVAIPTPSITDGNGCSEVQTTIYTILANGTTFFAGGNIADNDIVQLPIGTHTMILCAEDDCGNETCEEYTVIIRDEIEPTASCDDDLNVSIGGGDVLNGIEGIARIFATAVDEGSSDNCGAVTLEVRRNYWRNETCDDSANRWSPWGEYVDFYCCDIANEITIELRVTDESGNENICWMVITPEDKLNPYCYAPADVDLTCNDLPLAFPGDIETAYDEDFAATSIMMSDIFGGATGTDNCAVDTIVERTPNIQVNDCGWGQITRRFEAWQLKPEGDVNGNGAIDINEVFRSTNSCSQIITITEVHDFVIDFPEDAAADCGDPDVPTIITTTDGCDVLSINIGEPVIYSATGDECYKYSITYDVINWCLWDGEYTGYVLPRMTEDDGEALPIDRAVEGNERPVVRYSDDSFCIDRRHTDRDGDSNLANCDSPDLPNYGRYIYTQFVKVYDSTAPVVSVGEYGGPTANCPDLLAGQFGDDDGNCEEAVSIPFSVSDECELFDGDGALVISIVSAELDAFAVDANGDGDIKSNEFVAEAGAAGNVLGNITDNGDGTYSFDGTFPIITSAMGDNIYHAVRILFEDGCGNQTSETIVFDVIDCKGPAPVCINGLTVTLMPNEGEGCSMAIWASDFEGSPISDCTGQGPELFNGLPRVTKYAIYRAADVEADPDFVPSPDDTGLVLTDQDEETTIVYVYAFDEEGNYDYCETYILVQLHTTCGGEGEGTIAGIIMTEDAETVEGVEVSINGGMTAQMTTNTDGTYNFSNLALGGDYSVTPYLNTNPLNGVTTFDIVKISKHILNVDVLDGPYKRIAADANRSGTITTLDLIQIRKLILNVITAFPNNTSWRFVEADYDFPESTNPWSETFPELINENNLAGDILDADFVGVKIGDVNGSAQANAMASDDRTLNGTFNLKAEDIDMRAGNTYTVAVSADELNTIEGYQGTLQLSGVELLDIEYAQAQAANFGLRFVDQGMITTSWNWDGAATTADHLFSLVLRATEDKPLRQALSISSRYTAAEAYREGEMTDLGIEFTNGWNVAAEFELYQNTPNPFAAATLIGFNLPTDAAVTVTINDASGRVLKVIRGDYAAGYNTINVTKQMIQGATGVLSYTVEAGEHRATKQMIVVE